MGHRKRDKKKKRHLVGKLRTKPRFACKKNPIHTGKLDTDLTKMNNPREGMDEPLIANSNAMDWPKVTPDREVMKMTKRR